jgi:hypothetical protein
MSSIQASVIPGLEPSGQRRPLAKPGASGDRTPIMMQTPAFPAKPSPSQTPAPNGIAASTPAPASAIPQPISADQAAFLRARKSALSNQLESAQSRRDDVAEQLQDEKTQAAERPGLEGRLKVLDDRLVQLEQEIAVNSEQLANAPSTSRSSTAPAPSGGDRSGNRVTMPSMMGMLTGAVILSIIWQVVRRVMSPDRADSRRDREAERAAMQQRLDRMEGAVDAIAIEVERIGESQRFLTQSLTEGSPVNRVGLPVGGIAFEGVPVREQAAELRPR